MQGIAEHNSQKEVVELNSNYIYQNNDASLQMYNQNTIYNAK